MFRFFDIVEIQVEIGSFIEKIILDGTEMSESINDTGTEYASVEDPLNTHKTTWNEVTLILEIPSIIKKENVIIAPRQGGKTVLSLSN